MIMFLEAVYPHLVLDSEPIADELAVTYSAAPPAAAVKIRKDFPETWIWDMIDDNGCASASS